MTFSSREEREQYVIELYKQGKTIREIAQIVHMSFAGIGSIIKKYTGYDDNNNESNDDGHEIEKKGCVSNSTKAFKLFSQGKSPVQVAIKLDLGSEEVDSLYRQYWLLRGLYRLNELYEEVKDYLLEYSRLFSIMKKHGLTSKQQIVNAIKYANELPGLTDKVQKLKWDAELAEVKKAQAEAEWSDVQKRLWNLNNEIKNYQSVLDQKVQAVKYQEDQLVKLQASINSILSSETYQKIQQQGSKVSGQQEDMNGNYDIV